MDGLQQTIEAAWERRAELSPKTAPAECAKPSPPPSPSLDAGRLRVAEKIDGIWITHQWLKKAVLLSFRVADNGCRSGSSTRAPSAPFRFYRQGADEVRALRRAAFAQAGVRVVPPAVARRGAYHRAERRPDAFVRQHRRLRRRGHDGRHLGHGRLLRPDRQERAPVRRRGHRRGLEPLQANPTIIEDNCFIGARSEVVEGVIVEENSVLGMGVFIGQSTKIYDRAADDGQLRPRPGRLRGRRRQPRLRAKAAASSIAL